MRTITNPANNSTLSSSVVRNELQTLENEVADTSSGHDHDGTDSKQVAVENLIGSAWSSWTPTIYKHDKTTTVTPTNLSAYYVKIGKLVIGKFFADGLANTANAYFWVTLPVTAKRSMNIGTGVGYNGSNYYSSYLSISSANLTRMFIGIYDGTNGAVGNWGTSNNSIDSFFIYEAA